jgi:hypothetical protein
MNYVTELSKLDKREGRAEYIQKIFEDMGLDVNAEKISYGIPFPGRDTDIYGTLPLIDLNVYAEYKGNPTGQLYSYNSSS